MISYGLIVIWIFMTTTSDTNNLFYIWGIHERFFALDSSEVRLSFLIKMGALKAGQMEDAFLPLLGSENNAKFSIAFVLKTFVVFSLQNDIFIYSIAEIVKKLWAKM